MPAISIIIPVYKVERYLTETLASIREQCYADWEVVIVDDGSPDGSAAIAQQFVDIDARFRLVRQKNMGVSAARNHGFSLTSPDSQFITFMDADDVYLPNALEALMRTLHEQPAMIGAHGLADMIDADSAPINGHGFSDFQRARTGFDGRNLVAWGAEKPTTFETVVHHSRIYPPGLILTRREFVERAGPFDSSLNPVEDWDMLIRLTRLGPIAFYDNTILWYRRHPAQATTAALDRLYAATKRLHKKTRNAPENTPQHNMVIRGSFRAWQRMKISERMQGCRRGLSSGRWLAAAGDLLRVPAHAFLLTWGKPL